MSLIIGNPGGIGGGLTDGVKGDVTVSGSGSVIGINNGAVTLPKMANLPTLTLIGNKTGLSGPPAALTASEVVTMLGITSTTNYAGLGGAPDDSAAMTTALNNVIKRAGTLTGLDLVTNRAVVDTDTPFVAIGLLQRQVSVLLSALTSTVAGIAFTGNYPGVNMAGLLTATRYGTVGGNLRLLDPSGVPGSAATLTYVLTMGGAYTIAVGNASASKVRWIGPQPTVPGNGGRYTITLQYHPTDDMWDCYAATSVAPLDLGPMTLANLPSAASQAVGTTAYVTDVGPSGLNLIVNAAGVWRTRGAARILKRTKNTGSALATHTLTSTLSRAPLPTVLIPGVLIQAGTDIVVRGVYQIPGGTNGGYQQNLLLGPNNSAADLVVQGQLVTQDAASTKTMQLDIRIRVSEDQNAGNQLFLTTQYLSANANGTFGYTQVSASGVAPGVDQYVSVGGNWGSGGSAFNVTWISLDVSVEH